ncbi:MAG: right-handed parallel beta-helix repeat-containing protein [Kiritimatiellales bacterium]
MIQDCEIYSDGTGFSVRGQINHEILHQTQNATEAIQFALDNLHNEGGEVILHRGTYPLDEPIQLKNRVILRGKGRGSKLSITAANAQGVGIVCEGLKGAVITDLALTPAKSVAGVAGIILDSCGDCQVHDVLCQGFATYGIWVRNSSFLCEISSCQLVDNQTANLYLEDLCKGRAGDFLPNLVTDVTIYGGGVGIECNRALVVNITECILLHTKKYGIYVHNESNSVLISGCRTYQIETDAVVLEESHEINISSNIFCWHRGHGVILDGVKWGTVSANNIIDSGVRTPDKSLRNGLILKNDTRGVQVSGNAIFNWGDQTPMEWGVIEDDSCVKNIIAYNNINFFTCGGVQSSGRESVESHNLCEGQEAWIGMNRPGYPDFSREGIESFIRE